MTKKTVETPEKDRSEREPQAIAVDVGGAAVRHTLRNIRLILGREYKNRVTQRSFIITSIILLIIVFLAAFIPTIVQLIAKLSSSQTSIVVVNDAGSVAGLKTTALAAYIETIPERGQTERLLERITCWLIQTANDCHLYQAVALPPFWNGLQ